MSQPEKSYTVRVWTEGVDAAQYRSKISAASPLLALLEELEHIRDVDPAGLLEGQYAAVAVAMPEEG